MLDGFADLLGIETHLCQAEVEAEVELVWAHVFGESGVVLHPDLADGHRIGVVVEYPADQAVDVVHTVVVEPRIVVVVGEQAKSFVVHVRETVGFGHAVCHIDPEPVHSTVEPEPQRALEVGEHLWVVPVQVGLFGCEQMQIPLSGLAVGPGGACPCGAAENAGPVVGRLVAVFSLAVAEDVAFARRAPGLCGEGFDEPGVLVAGVVGHQVHRDLDAPPVGLGDEQVEGFESAEQRVDIARVGHVVAVVGHR